MKTIEIDFLVSGTKITIPFKALCSVTNKTFQGDVVVEYSPDKKVIEYVDAETTVERISKEKLTAEEFTFRIFKMVSAAISPKYLKVLVDVQKSRAHQPVQVWIEKKFETK